MKATIPQKPEDDEESDELPSDFDMSEKGEDGEGEEDDDGEGEEDDDGEGEEVDDDEGEEEEDGLELAEESDNDDLVSLDGMMEYNGTEWGGVELEEAGKKRKRRDEWKERRKKLRSLPTFASYDEYAKMIDDAPEDDI
jgi:ribosome biogenesis protein MAK21